MLHYAQVFDNAQGSDTTGADSSKIACTQKLYNYDTILSAPALSTNKKATLRWPFY